jgi:hypothetical protein
MDDPPAVMKLVMNDLKPVKQDDSVTEKRSDFVDGREIWVWLAVALFALLVLYLIVSFRPK